MINGKTPPSPILFPGITRVSNSTICRAGLFDEVLEVPAELRRTEWHMNLRERGLGREGGSSARAYAKANLAPLGGIGSCVTAAACFISPSFAITTYIISGMLPSCDKPRRDVADAPDSGDDSASNARN